MIRVRSWNIEQQSLDNKNISCDISIQTPSINNMVIRVVCIHTLFVDQIIPDIMNNPPGIVSGTVSVVSDPIRSGLLFK